MSDLLWYCETLTSTVDTSVALFSSVLVKRVRIQMSVVPGATTFINERFSLKSRLDNKVTILHHLTR